MRFRYTPQRFRDVKEHKHLDFIVWLNSKRTTMKIELSFVHDDAAVVQVLNARSIK